MEKITVPSTDHLPKFQTLLEKISLAMKSWPIESASSVDQQDPISKSGVGSRCQSSNYTLAEGLKRLHKLVLQEQDSLLKLSHSSEYKDNDDIIPPNLRFFWMLFRYLTHYKNKATDCLRIIKYSAKKDDGGAKQSSVRIDAVLAEQGMVWVKVINKRLSDYWNTLGIIEAENSNSAIDLDEDWRPFAGSVIQLPFIQQIMKYKEASKYNPPIEGEGPRMRIILRKDFDTFDDPLKAAGMKKFEDVVIEVLDSFDVELGFCSLDERAGQVIDVVSHSSRERIHSTNGKANANDTSVISQSSGVHDNDSKLLILDVTTLSALVSDLTHSYPNPPDPANFSQRHQVRLQAEFEHTSPVLPVLFETFQNKTLATTESAYVFFKRLVDDVGSSTEAARVNGLFQCYESECEFPLQNKQINKPSWQSWLSYSQQPGSIPCVRIIPSTPSKRVNDIFLNQAVSSLGPFKKLHRDIIGTTDELNATLVTANAAGTKYLNKSGIDNIHAIVHSPRSLFSA
ncbi:hypothetical protein H4219_001955 [Mycoemilia scoparia]|uniref:DUF1308 domain-containing protein n=1 Tax=Mycoemilia scoparia TaxID=417184 RepID=A0A9W7ZZ17_9FUNG|nr:hypothetical protein H4219_001955 [Mycoemilia scoparia]